MQDTFDQVNSLGHVSQKIPVVKQVVVAFAQQSVECATFIRQYTRPGFLGNIQLATQVSWLSNVIRSGRMKDQLLIGTKKKIKDFKNAFDLIQRRLQGSTDQQILFISANISETVDQICMFWTF